MDRFEKARIRRKEKLIIKLKDWLDREFTKEKIDADETHTDNTHITCVYTMRKGVKPIKLDL